MIQETKEELRALFAKYTALGYTTLDIEYSGSGDEGSTDSLAMTDADDCVRNDYRKKLELKTDEAQLAEDLAEHILDESNLSHYGNNEGGQGHLYIDLTTGEVEVEHETNFIDTLSSCSSLGLFDEEDAEEEEEAEETITA